MRSTSPGSQLRADATVIRRGATSFAARARSERSGLLSINQTAVLGMLFRIGDMTPGEIAHKMRVQPQALTRTFTTLEQRSQVRRLPDPSDGRQSLLSITAAGRRALQEEMRPRDEWVAGVLESELTLAERELLVVAAGLLERLAYVDLTVRREA